MTQLASMGGDTAADNQADGGGDTRAPEPYVLNDGAGPLSRDELGAIDAWWRAANYLAVGQICLLDNPLLRDPLQPEHIKPRLLGHFGTVPGLNLVWAHANRQITARGLDAVFVAGPGHGGPGPNACGWLEGTYSELYSHITRDEPGMATFLDDDKSIEVVFVVGEVRSRSDLSAQLPERVAARIVDVNAGARAAVDEDELARQIDAELMLRRVASMDDAAQRFVAELGRGSGLATEGLPGVCAALRDGSVETLIIGEIGDATVVLGDGLTTVAPNADVLSEMGSAPALFARADEALPLAAVAVDASLVRTDERIAPNDGVAAVLRFAARR